LSFSFPIPVVRRGGRLECWQLEAVPRLRTWQVRRELARLHGAHAAIVEAWSRLAMARRDHATRSDLLLVLGHTSGVPASRAVPLPSLAWGPCDVRPWLDDPAAVTALLRTLAAPLDDTYLLAQHGIGAATGAIRWAPAFAQLLLPWLRGMPLETLRAAERAFLALAPWPDESFVAMASAVAAGGQPAWLQLAAEEPYARRALFLHGLLRAEAFHVAPPRDAARLFTALRYLGRADTAARDLSYAFTGLRLGATPSHLAASLRLGRDHGWEPSCDKPTGDVPCRAIDRLVRRFYLYRGAWKPRSERLWKLSCALPGSGEILRAVARWRMSDDERYAMVSLLGKFRRDGDKASDRKLPRWKALYARWQDVLSVARRTPPTHRRKAWELIGTLGSQLRIDSEPALMGDILRFVGQVCRAPFDRDADAEWIAALLFIAAENRNVLLDPAAKAWRVIEEQCRSGNRNWLMGEGLAALADAPAGFVGRALREHPRVFLAAIAELGILRKVARSQVWRTFSHHPSVSCDPQRMPLAEAIVLLDAVALGTGVPAPVAKPLRMHTSGARLLEPHRLAHYRAGFVTAWVRVQIEILRGLIERELWRGFPAASAGVQRHTLELAQTITKNRAPLRRIIRTCDVAPEQSVRTTHARNRDWLLAHRLAGSLWEAGNLTFIREIPSIGEVALGFENDPQTVLRMGTEVGSCLGVGGCNDFSAVANALDANKRVLYARDARGRFLARQLLAISEKRTLVCFPVYPDNAIRPLTDFFRLCNETLAQTLHLPLQDFESDYHVAPLICPDWYDDGVWEA